MPSNEGIKMLSNYVKKMLFVPVIGKVIQTADKIAFSAGPQTLGEGSDQEKAHLCLLRGTYAPGNEETTNSLLPCLRL